MFERYGKSSFGVRPAIRDDGYVVVGWDRFEHGHSKRNVMFIFRVSLTKGERIMEGYHLTIHIFDHDGEGLRRTMNFFIPLKIRYDGKIDLK